MFQVLGSWTIIQIIIVFISPRPKYSCQNRLPNNKRYVESLQAPLHTTTKSGRFKKNTQSFFFKMAIFQLHGFSGGATFPYYTYRLRPYASSNLNREKTIFNKRLSRGRVTIEWFGILSNKWRIFMKSIGTSTKHARLIIKLACLLHSIVRSSDGNSDKNFQKYIVNLQANDNRLMRSRRNNRASLNAINIRDQYKNYFVNNNPI